jgi:hypothetical protein
MTSGDLTHIGMVMELPWGFHENKRMIAWEATQEPVGTPILHHKLKTATKWVSRIIGIPISLFRISKLRSTSTANARGRWRG